MDNLVERKLVRVACEKVEGNEQGFYITYEDAIPEGSVLFEEPAVDPVDPTAKQPAKKA